MKRFNVVQVFLVVLMLALGVCGGGSGSVPVAPVPEQKVGTWDNASWDNSTWGQ